MVKNKIKQTNDIWRIHSMDDLDYLALSPHFVKIKTRVYFLPMISSEEMYALWSRKQEAAMCSCDICSSGCDASSCFLFIPSMEEKTQRERWRFLESLFYINVCISACMLGRVLTFFIDLVSCKNRENENQPRYVTIWCKYEHYHKSKWILQRR